MSRPRPSPVLQFFPKAPVCVPMGIRCLPWAACWAEFVTELALKHLHEPCSHAPPLLSCCWLPQIRLQRFTHCQPAQRLCLMEAMGRHLYIGKLHIRIQTHGLSAKQRGPGAAGPAE